MEGRDQGGRAMNTRPGPRRQIHGQGGKAAGAHMQDGQVRTARPSGQHVERGTATGTGGSLQQEKARRAHEAHTGRGRGGEQPTEGVGLLESSNPSFWLLQL